jgi:hypothetical protein
MPSVLGTVSVVLPTMFTVLSRLQHGFSLAILRRTPIVVLDKPEHRIRQMERCVFLDLDAGTTVKVVDGCVWLTRDGCPEDVVLEGGQTFTNLGGPRVLIHALEASKLLLAPASPVVPQ